MSEDDYNERLLMAHLEEQDTYNELIEEEQDIIINNLSVGDVEDFEFVENLFEFEGELVEALAKNENNRAIDIIRRVFDNQILNVAMRKVDNM
jgi:hypothetical protein